MKKMLPLLLSLGAATAIATSAMAADAVVGQEPSPAPTTFDDSRFYVSGFAGANFISEVTLEGNVNAAPQTVEIDFDTGFVIGGAIGHSYGEIADGVALRAELELSYSDNSIDQIFFSGNGPAAEINVNGDFTTTNLVVNALLDLPKHGNDVFTPYFGGGLGVAFTEIDAVYGPGVRLDSDDENFIAQAIIGASFAATDDADFFVEGRYSRIFDVETPRFAPSGALTGIVEDDFDIFAVNAGIRVKF